MTRCSYQGLAVLVGLARSGDFSSWTLAFPVEGKQETKLEEQETSERKARQVGHRDRTAWFLGGGKDNSPSCSWSNLCPTTPFLSIIDSFYHISHQSDAHWIPFLQPFALSLLLPFSPHLIQGWVPLCFDITTQICLFPLHEASSPQPVGQFLICSSSYVATCCY